MKSLLRWVRWVLKVLPHRSYKVQKEWNKCSTAPLFEKYLKGVSGVKGSVLAFWYYLHCPQRRQYFWEFFLHSPHNYLGTLLEKKNRTELQFTYITYWLHKTGYIIAKENWLVKLFIANIKLFKNLNTVSGGGRIRRKSNTVKQKISDWCVEIITDFGIGNSTSIRQVEIQVSQKVYCVS